MLKSLVFAAAFLVLSGHGRAQEGHTFPPSSGVAGSESAAFSPHGTDGLLRSQAVTGEPMHDLDRVRLPSFREGAVLNVTAKIISIRRFGMPVLEIPCPIQRGKEVQALLKLMAILDYLDPNVPSAESVRATIDASKDVIFQVAVNLMNAETDDLAKQLDALHRLKKEAPHTGHCKRPDPAECLPDAPPGAKCCIKCHAVCKEKRS